MHSDPQMEYDQWAAAQQQPAQQIVSVAQRRRMLLAIILIGLGAFWLLDSINGLDNLARLWPVGLILVGSWFILGPQRRRIWMLAMVPAALLASVAILTVGSHSRGDGINPALIDGGLFASDTIEQATLTCTSQMNDLRISTTPSHHAPLLTTNGAMELMHSGMQRSPEYKVTSDMMINDADTHITLASMVPWGITCDSTASSLQADLSSMSVRYLDLTVDAGDSTIVLPVASDQPIRLTINAGELDVTVPDGVAAQIDIDGTVSDVDVDERFTQLSSDSYVIQGADEDQPVLKVTIKVNAGSVELH